MDLAHFITKGRIAKMGVPDCNVVIVYCNFQNQEPPENKYLMTFLGQESNKDLR